MIGKRFGFLVVTQKSNHGWLCQCDCGAVSVVWKYRLLSGHTKSCGCRRVIVSTKHGKTHTRTWRAWEAMHQRCNNPNNQNYRHYGLRGITVCAEWKSFEAFLADMGEVPSKMSLGRIDNNKGYAKSNCRWETQKQQLNNRRNNVVFDYHGIRQTLTEWCESLGLNRNTVNNRYRKGWTVERILSTTMHP